MLMSRHNFRIFKPEIAKVQFGFYTFFCILSNN